MGDAWVRIEAVDAVTHCRAVIHLSRKGAEELRRLLTVYSGGSLHPASVAGAGIVVSTYLEGKPGGGGQP